MGVKLATAYGFMNKGEAAPDGGTLPMFEPIEFARDIADCWCRSEAEHCPCPPDWPLFADTPATQMSCVCKGPPSIPPGILGAIAGDTAGDPALLFQARLSFTLPATGSVGCM